MATDVSSLTVWTTRPAGIPAARLRELGFVVNAMPEDEGPVDRYILGPHLAVERRTAQTFLQGIQDKTLFISAIYLREHFEAAVLIIEGELRADATGFHPQAIRGALSALVLEYGLSVLSTPDTEETVHQLAMMARHAQTGVPEISLVPKRKATDLPDLQRRVVEMLPGCGRVAARDLLQSLGSVAHIVEATPEELSQVRGIGKKRAAEIARVLHVEYRAVDTERDLEDAVEATPRLLFDHPMTLLDRQHVIMTPEGGRHVVDLVFLDPDTAELVLVELKRGALNAEHEAQLRRYFDVAHQSPLLSPYLKAGSVMRGVLATVTGGDYSPAADNITARVVDEALVIEVLITLRRQRRAQA